MVLHIRASSEDAARAWARTAGIKLVHLLKVGEDMWHGFASDAYAERARRWKREFPNVLPSFRRDRNLPA